MTVEPDVDVDGPLGAFIALAVADDYAAVDPQRPGEHRPAGRRDLVVALAAVGVALLIGVIAAVAILTARSTDDTRARTHDELEQRVAALAATVDQRQAEVDEATAQVDALQGLLLDSDAAAAQAARSDRLAAQSAMEPVTGPGVTVTIDDAPGAGSGSLNRVLDRDLQLIVNALWKQGATGVAINGRRLTDLTAIRSAGDAILVDYRPLSPPYRVDATGVSAEGADATDLRTLLDELSTSYGLGSSIAEGEVTLPAGDLRAPHVASVGAGPAQEESS